MVLLSDIQRKATWKKCNMSNYPFLYKFISAFYWLKIVFILIQYECLRCSLNLRYSSSGRRGRVSAFLLYPKNPKTFVRNLTLFGNLLCYIIYKGFRQVIMGGKTDGRRIRRSCRIIKRNWKQRFIEVYCIIY